MKLSYILPTYNVEKYVKECIDSLYFQNLKEKDFEVIVIVDGSTDNSLNIVQDLQKEHSNIVIIRQANQGVSIARNNGIKIAKGEYIAFVDPDDAIISNTIQSIIKVLDETNANVFIGDFHGIEIEDWESQYREDCNNKDIANYHTTSMSGMDFFNASFNIRKGYCFLYVSRRDYLIREQLKFPDHIVFTEDVWFSINLILHATTVIHSDLTFYAYRNYHGSACSHMNNNKILSMFWVSRQMHLLKAHYRGSTRKKIDSCSFFIYNLAIWFLSHYEKVFSERKHILKGVSNKVIYTNSIFHFIISLWFYILPESLIVFSNMRSKKNYKQPDSY